MKKNLTARTVVIVVTLLLCVYGIIGFPKSKASLMQNFQKNIRLGLDLKGGSHLVLQVQVQDAVKADADQTMERLKEDLKKQNIALGGMDRNDPQTRRRCRQGRDHHQGHPFHADQRLPQPRHRALSHLRSDRRQLHRLHA